MIRRKINGIETNLLTIGELGKLSKKSTVTLKKWEDKGWLPVANWRNKKIDTKDGGKINGERLYTEKYALLIAEKISSVKKGIKVPHETIQELANLFKKERIEFMTPPIKK